MKKTESDEYIMLAAQEAARWQQIIRDAAPFEEFSESGKLKWLKENVFAPIEKEVMLMIRGLEFVPNSVAQVAHVKGQLEIMDRIESRILTKIREATDARQKLDELSTPPGGE